MQMHDAVRTVFQSIIADGPLASDAEGQRGFQD
jgi:hypothetical protein